MEKLESLVLAATEGDKLALQKIVEASQNKIYGLALRMLVNPEDAMDATQEIMVKVITNLGSFKFESKFHTWAYRIAVNHLLNVQRSLRKDPEITFEEFKQDLETDLHTSNEWQDDPHYSVLLNELRISCTMAMLLCLNSAHRVAYILGEIFELDHNDACEILSISKNNFRKRLSRARAEVYEFTNKSCGLVSSCATCRCETKLDTAIKNQRVIPTNTYFSAKPRYSYDEVKTALVETQIELRAIASQKSVGLYECPVELGEYFGELVQGQFQ
ncbi:RNA polymerase sigma factor [Pseudoalteromonas sp. T1lg65]|uniref:RNA polymerase sigma factor n=1 Tax=Pseudoalteromonas sp. T1lg65 TaxID=2077101 RepID=UPI003F797F68